jgi:hypothetical protein
MAITETNLPGNGTAGPFTYTFPALEAGDIYVSVDGVVKTVTTDYSLNFVGKQITFLTTPYPTVSNVIRIYRVTDDADLAATFYSGAAIRATDLNTNFTQGLYVTQESNREAATAISTAGGAVTTANAATATANSAVSTANAATATANTALSNSSAAVSTANTASSNASAAVSTANTASSNATTAVSTANAATATANSAASDAATAISTANSAVSTANTASTTATNAVNTANSASSAASSAVSTANTASSNASAAVSTANTASSNATSAVNTANSALSTANAAASAVANAILYDIVANVAAIPASPANNDAVEVTDSTGIESFTPLTSIPGGFAGNSGLSVRIVYTTTGNTWTWIQYFPNDPETRYLKEAVTTSDTAPVSPSDGDLWYDSVGGRTYVYYDDGDTSQWVDTSPQGSGVSDAISEGNTSAEVIDTGSDGRFVVTTEGSERLRITSAGLVGIGTNSPNNKLDVVGVTQVYDSRGTSVYDSLKLIGGSAVDFPTIEAVSTTSPLHFKTNSNVRMAITSTGLVGIGTNSPSVSLHVVGGGMFASSTTGGSIVQARNSDFSSLGYFGVEGSTGGVTLTGTLANSTFISSGASGTPLQFGTGGVIRSTLTSTGLGIGTSSPDGKLHVEDTANDLQVRVGGATAGRDPLIRLQGRNTADNTNVYADIKLDSDNRLLLLNDPGTTGGSIGQNPVAITETGAVGIGTTSPGMKLTINDTTTAQIQLGYNDSIYGRIGRNSSGNYEFSSYENGGNLLFGTTGTTGSTTERARIDSSGRLLVGTSTSSNVTRAEFYGQSSSSTEQAIVRFGRGSNPGGAGDHLTTLQFAALTSGGVYATIEALCDATPGTNDYPGRLTFSTTADGASTPTERMRLDNKGAVSTFATNDTAFAVKNSATAGTTISNIAGFYSATGTGNGTASFRVYTNGNVVNTNNSYGAISDIKLKENIVDASSQWDDLKALQVRNYNFKEGQTHTQIGLVAQEAELVSPGLVTESPDCDEDGNDLGTVTKSVNYSVLYMKAVKALQEAMTRIETLEAANTDLAARLTALEGGTN